MAKPTFQEKKDVMRELKHIRARMYAAAELRLITSNTLFDVMRETADRSDWHWDIQDPVWRSVPVVTDRRLDGLRYEFVKVWSSRQDASYNLDRPLLSSAGLRRRPEIKD